MHELMSTWGKKEEGEKNTQKNKSQGMNHQTFLQSPHKRGKGHHHQFQSSSSSSFDCKNYLWCLGLKCLVLMHSVDVALQILLNGSVGGLSPLLNSLYHLNTYCSRCR